jgi:hypothetical protein
MLVELLTVVGSDLIGLFVVAHVRGCVTQMPDRAVGVSIVVGYLKNRLMKFLQL